MLRNLILQVCQRSGWRTAEGPLDLIVTNAAADDLTRRELARLATTAPHLLADIGVFPNDAQDLGDHATLRSTFRERINPLTSSATSSSIPAIRATLAPRAPSAYCRQSARGAWLG